VLWLQTALKNEKSGAARADFNPTKLGRLWRV
jgi:hypothetical protein